MLEIKNLTGGYVHVPVLKDVSFTVESGQLVGLIGLNGAGKSTTINEIIGLLTPYSGSININGLTLQEDATSYRKQIGYIPETPSLYEELTLRHVKGFAQLQEISLSTHLTLVENNKGITHPLRRIQHVGTHENGLTLLLFHFQKLNQVCNSQRIKTKERLIHDEKTWIHHKSTDNHDLLLHPF